jgi:hypothetical protein
VKSKNEKCIKQEKHEPVVKIKAVGVELLISKNKELLEGQEVKG